MFSWLILLRFRAVPRDFMYIIHPKSLNPDRSRKKKFCFLVKKRKCRERNNLCSSQKETKTVVVIKIKRPSESGSEKYQINWKIINDPKLANIQAIIYIGVESRALEHQPMIT